MIRGGEQKPSKSSQLLGQISSYLSHLPSAAATPSKAFKRPLKLSVEPSELSESLSFLEEEEDELDELEDEEDEETLAEKEEDDDAPVKATSGTFPSPLILKSNVLISFARQARYQVDSRRAHRCWFLR